MDAVIDPATVRKLGAELQDGSKWKLTTVGHLGSTCDGFCHEQLGLSLVVLYSRPAKTWYIRVLGVKAIDLGEGQFQLREPKPVFIKIEDLVLNHGLKISGGFLGDDMVYLNTLLVKLITARKQEQKQKDKIRALALLENTIKAIK